MGARGEVEVVETATAIVVTPIGEFDVTTAERLRVAMGGALADAALTGKAVVVDCARITFVDVCAFRVIAEASMRARTSRCEFRLENPPVVLKRVAQVFRRHTPGAEVAG